MPSSKQGLSIIIPIAEKEEQHFQLLTILLNLFQEQNNNHYEIIISSTNSEQETALDNFKKTVTPEQTKNLLFILSGKPSRAKQMNIASNTARYSHLWFLHADSIPNNDAVDKLKCAIDNEEKKITSPLFYFKLQFYDQYSSLLWLTGLGANFRSRFLKTPFGDQGFCLSKTSFEKLGRYNEQVRYGEDHLLVWQAHLQGLPLQAVNAYVKTSARKYNERGWFQQTVVHWFYWLQQAIPQLFKLLHQRLTAH